MGVATLLLVLVSGSAYFALRALDSGRSPTAAVATPPPPPPLTLLAPAVTVTSADRVDLTAVQPAGLRQDQAYAVRLYVNGDLVRERPLPAEQRFVLSGVPLVEGPNSIRVALTGAGGESDKSAEVSVTRDGVAPDIQVTQPAPGATLYSAEVLLTGRTEAGATLTITGAGGRDIDVSLQEHGRFSAALELDLGSNRFVLRSVDQAGNRSSTRVVLVRQSSAASLSLAISPQALVSADLPQRITLVALVRDELGRPIDGAQVTFSVSPPDRETQTYRVLTVNGRARWSDLVIDNADTPGTWLITALATLPSGLELRQDGSFSLE